MASSDQQQLLLQIDASTEILRSEMARATATIASFEATTESQLDAVKEKFETLGETVGETAKKFAELGAEILIGQGIKEAIEHAIEYSETLNKTASQLGVTTTFLQEFRFAATNSAVSSEAADKSLAKFSVTLGRAADGNKTAAAAFADIGVKIADADGNLRPAEAIFRDVADAIARMKSPAEQAAAAVAIFGRGGQSLLPILKAGSAGFDEFADKVKKTGGVLSEGTIDRLEELSNATKNLKNQISTELARIIGDNADALIRLGEAALNAAKKFGYLLDQARGARFLSGQGERLEALFSSGETLATLGTPTGQVAYLRKRVAEQRQVVAREAANPTLDTSTASEGVNVSDSQSGLVAARLELAARQKALDAATDASVHQALQDNPLRPLGSHGDEGVTGGKVKPVDDPEARRAAEQAQREAEAAAKAAEARLTGLKNELDTLDAQVVGEQAKGAATPEAKLAADIAAAKANTNRDVTKQLNAAGDDTTVDQKAVRAKIIADIKTLGAERIAALQDNYDREHAAALAAIEEGTTQQLTANRAANVALIKDDDERADAEKAIVVDEVDAQIAKIETLIATSKKLTTEEIAALRAKESALQASKDVKIAGIDRANQGPVQDYLDTLPDTAAKTNAAFQHTAVDGLKAFDDGLTGIITGSESVAGAFKKMADSIVADLVRIAVEKEIVGPLASALGLGDAGGGGLGGLAKLLGFADGGDPPVGVPSIVGERGPELFVPKSAGTIIPNHLLGGGGGGGGEQRVSVQIETLPSPLFAQVVRQATASAAASAAASAVGALLRPPISQAHG